MCLKKKLFLVIVILLFVMTIIYLFCSGFKVLGELCTAEVNAEVNNIINASNEVVLGLDIFYEDLFTLRFDKDDKISAVIANSDLINKITLIWSTEIQNRLNQMRNLKFSIPSGVITGSALLAQFGVKLEATAQVVSNCLINYKSEFTSAGINQTRHRFILYTDVFANVSVPRAAEDVSVSQEIILAESILVGNVPSTYLIESSENSHLDLLPGQ